MRIGHMLSASGKESSQDSVPLALTLYVEDAFPAVF